MMRRLYALVFGLITLCQTPAVFADPEEMAKAQAAMEEFMGGPGASSFKGHSNFFGQPCDIQFDIKDDGFEVTLNGAVSYGSGTIFNFRYIMKDDENIKQTSTEVRGDILRLKGRRIVQFNGEAANILQEVSLKKRNGQLHSVYLFDWDAGMYTMSMTCVID